MNEITCKVDHVTDRRRLTAPGQEYGSIDQYLVARWTGEDGPALGYKPLTEWFNKRLLKQVYERNGRDTTGPRVDSEYEALTGDDDLVRHEVLNDLQDSGIAAESLVDDMVSWSTMRRHLNECLGEEKPTTPSETDWERRSVDIARERTREKVTDALGSLARKGMLPEASKADVQVQIKLSCPECPTRVPLEDALRRGYVCKDHFEEAGSPATSGTSPSRTD